MTLKQNMRQRYLGPGGSLNLQDLFTFSLENSFGNHKNMNLTRIRDVISNMMNIVFTHCVQTEDSPLLRWTGPGGSL